LHVSFRQVTIFLLFQVFHPILGSMSTSAFDPDFVCPACDTDIVYPEAGGTLLASPASLPADPEDPTDPADPEDQELEDLITLPYGKYLYIHVFLQQRRDVIFYGMGPSDPGDDWGRVKYCRNMYVHDPSGQIREEFGQAAREAEQWQEEGGDILEICKLVDEMYNRARKGSI